MPVDLSVNFMGLELRNPLVVASAETARDIRQIRQAEACGASAVILKATLPPGVIGMRREMRISADVKKGILHGIAANRRLTFDECLELLRAAKKESKIKIGVNIPYNEAKSAEIYADVITGSVKLGADFIEVNVSPQIPHHVGQLQSRDEWQADTRDMAEKIGEKMQQIPMLAYDGVRAVKALAGNTPVLAKLAPEGINVVAVAKAMEAGGADAIDACNSMGGAFMMDIYNGGRPIIPGSRNSMLRVSGAPYKWYAQGIQARVARAVKIPLMGTGGLMNWSDVVESIMFGCTAVSFCALLMIRGFEAMAEIEKKLKEFMEEQGYSRIEDFRGLALQYVAPSQPECDVFPCVARVDMAKCTLCNLCLRPAHCVAITREDDQIIIDEEECLGCGTCYLLCPTGAIAMVET